MEYVDAHDEDLCNWMMFVRPATNPVEQNLVAYQHGNDIFFTVTKNIEPRQELKVRQPFALKPVKGLSLIHI